MKTALVVGAAGAVGSELVRQLCEHENYAKVIVLARKQLKFSHEKLEVKIVNFDEISNLPSLFVDEVFCALGTTIKQAGSKEQFKKVDFHYTIKIATWAKNGDAKRFVLMSSNGADENSKFFYLQVKGEVENRIKELGFYSFHVARLPLIDAKRDEFRLGERFAVWLFKFIPKSILKAHHPMTPASIAKAVIKATQSDESGMQIYHPREIK
ncbi:NAD(P)H-binding protein [Campylobacter sp. RM16192]|uniref:NAD(P)H-binding protein n=1 Tax=Campylobacter sp. RM16192 TaxID=1660080 RepID=UPI0014526677|nr:NAD(P)H-binding protein [Campylobacter sp. RM16192]QCD53012.1 atypical short-chain dehydrogenase/reductase, CC3-like [Campylobacter sp. RM16192]